jgi:hypothetical protein
MPKGSSEGVFRKILSGMVEDIPILALSFIPTIPERIHLGARRAAARPHAARQNVVAME